MIFEYTQYTLYIYVQEYVVYIGMYTARVYVYIYMYIYIYIYRYIYTGIDDIRDTHKYIHTSYYIYIIVFLDGTPTICPTTYMGWGGVAMVTFLQPRSFDLAHDVDATLTWGGVG